MTVLRRKGQVELVGKRLPLRLARGEIVVVVEPDFADGNDLPLLQRALDAEQVGVVRLAGGVRVDACAAEDVVVQ